MTPQRPLFTGTVSRYVTVCFLAVALLAIWSNVTGSGGVAVAGTLVLAVVVVTCVSLALRSVRREPK